MTTTTPLTELEQAVQQARTEYDATLLRLAETQRQLNDTTTALSNPDLSVDEIERLLLRQSALQRAVDNANLKCEHAAEEIRKAQQQVLSRAQRVDDAERLLQYRQNDVSAAATSVADYEAKLSAVESQANSAVANARAQLENARKKHTAAIEVAQQAERSLAELRGDV